jgi:hypothetical protein
MTTNTTLAQKSARRKFGLLELAGELENVSKACKIMGYSREQFYEIRRNFQAFGAEGLLDKVRGAKWLYPNRISEEIEKAILDYCLEFPTHRCLRVSQQLVLRGIHAGVGAVRGAWQRHNISSIYQRSALQGQQYRIDQKSHHFT